LRLLPCSKCCCGIRYAENQADKPVRRLWRLSSIIGIAAALTSLASAASSPPINLFGVSVEFIIFALTLLGLAVFHHRTLQVALTGLAAIVLYKFVFTGFKTGVGLTGLALHMQQGGYDLSYLAYTVGFGGSMIWFGSSAGVALSNMYPEAKSVVSWVKNGRPVAVAYVFGFFAMPAIPGWKPGARHKRAALPAIHVTMGNAS
jgi:hypothetical protein